MSRDLAALCTPDCPELAPVLAGLNSAGASSAVRRSAVGQLADPTRPAIELAGAASATLDDVRAAYRLLRGDRTVAALTASMFYPHRLKHQLAVQTTTEWVADPARLAQLLAGEPVLAKTVEIHPSKAPATTAARCACGLTRQR